VKGELHDTMAIHERKNARNALSMSHAGCSDQQYQMYVAAQPKRSVELDRAVQGRTDVRLKCDKANPLLVNIEYGFQFDGCN
jgi:hypothetical protein